MHKESEICSEDSIPSSFPSSTPFLAPHGRYSAETALASDGAAGTTEQYVLSVSSGDLRQAMLDLGNHPLISRHAESL